MDSLRCLILPTREWTFVLPCATVAEIVSYKPLEETQETSEWLLSMFEWRGLLIPLISLELINQSIATIRITAQAHVAVLNRTEDKSTVDYYGVLLSGVPRMGRFEAKDIALITSCLEPQLSMEVQISGEKLFIPNIAWIEEKVNSLPGLPTNTVKL